MQICQSDTNPNTWLAVVRPGEELVVAFEGRDGRVVTDFRNGEAKCTTFGDSRLDMDANEITTFFNYPIEAEFQEKVTA